MTIRSYLYVPGNRPDLFLKAIAGEADAVILDLEDSIPPAGKSEARSRVCSMLATPCEITRSLSLLVRINSGALGVEDARHLPIDKLKAVVLPKAQSAEELAALGMLLAERERSSGVPEGHTEILPQIESVTGLYSIDDMSAATARVKRFSFGAGDFVHDLGARATAGRQETLFARSMLVARSSFLGLDSPVAHVFTPVKDVVGLEKACEEDLTLGFGARTCIHPCQLGAVNRVFAVSTADVARARAILNTYEDALRKGSGAMLLDDGTFVDAAIARWASRILARSTDNI